MKSLTPLFIFFLALVFGCKDDLRTEINGFELEVNAFDEGAGIQRYDLIVRIKGTLAGMVEATYHTQDKSAREGNDFLPATGTLTFSPENIESVSAVDIIGDTHLELTEEFSLIVTYEGHEYPFLITIRDDDGMEPILEDNDGFYTLDTHASMQRVWSDEFQGQQLDLAFWINEIGNGCDVGICGWGNNELESYTNDTANCKVDDGKLIITAITSGGSYTSARIKTQEKMEIQFGRIDVRAKLPKGQGIWPAIWMLGENITTVGWPMCGEIDIMELVGHQPSTVHGTVHYNSGGYKQSTGSTTLTASDFSDKFHVFSIVWDRNTITWYVDNLPFKTFVNDNIAGYPFNAPFFFIFNVAVGGNWPGAPDMTTEFPQSMVVDYVRVFR